MTLALSLLAQLLHIGLMIAAAPTVAGLLGWLDARLAGRTGPPPLLPWRDLLRLSRKTPMLLESASVVSRVAPAVGLGVTAAVAALVPSFTLGMALSPLADVLVVLSLLTVARVAAALAALDSGAALPGLAQQGASALAVLAEPALMLAMVALGLMGGSFNLDLIIGQQREGVLLPAAASAVVLTALLALVLAETGDAAEDIGGGAAGNVGGGAAGNIGGGAPEDFGGIDLTVTRATFWLRRLVWFDLIAALFLPVGMATADTGPLVWLIGLAAWALKLGGLTLALAAIRTLIGGVPPQGLPDLIGVAVLLALLATIMVLVSAGMA